MNAELKQCGCRGACSPVEEHTLMLGDSVPFLRRHIGPRPEQIKEMLSSLSLRSLEELAEKTVPAGIRLKQPLSLPEPLSEAEALAELSTKISKNQVYRAFIGMGYSETVTPNVILRNILENPGWYTQYTPYQAEISQGRLEALVNYQTMISDLTGLQISNASLLDEGTAAAEAMMLAHRLQGSETKSKFFIAADCHPQTISVVRTRAIPLGIEAIVGDVTENTDGFLNPEFFGALIQYPNTDGKIVDYRDFVRAAHNHEVLVIAACDLLSLTLLTPPGEWGADVAVGSSQRFGVPLGFGGPHAAFFSTKDEYKRELPGRLIGVSKDAQGKPAYRLALQTREQHIRRDKATSNICTAQVLLAVMASMYAVYHGPRGLKKIAGQIHALTTLLASRLTQAGLKLQSNEFFDTLRIVTSKAEMETILVRARAKQLNLRLYSDGNLGVSLGEQTSLHDVETLIFVFTGKTVSLSEKNLSWKPSVPAELLRKSDFLTHPVFSSYHSEHEMLRYLTRLQSRDLSLTTSMIPLGSCTMKLNATAEMIPVTWGAMANLHPFAPLEQASGYLEMIAELEHALAEVTGLPGVSLQPNAGSQGEYAGLLVIRAYHEKNGQTKRNICLIPTSAHGTNPASAVMAGMKVVTVQCDEAGNVNVEDLRSKAELHKGELSALMITYPSTHGVFESSIREICEIIHNHGGLVYMDGANMNAQVGLCRPGDFGVDVCHLNLHKTFCIPHGGGGPGIGPIAVHGKLKAFLPGHFHFENITKLTEGPVSASPWGSAGILAIPWTYIRMMGGAGLKEATLVAILNANYIAHRLEPHFPVLYRGETGMVAHECILDLRNFKRAIGVEVADVAKRLMDYGFHAPTVSFPVVETLMVEPTESESKEELDRFCDALISIRQEIREIEEGTADRNDNLLKNAPHTADAVCATNWTHSYSRERAAFPSSSSRSYKFWPAVSRIDNTWGDRNLFCSCVPIGDS